jgi:outer membrane protein TolC
LEHKRIAQLRYDTGLGIYSDVLRTSTALAEAEQKLTSANTSLKVSRRALGLLLGLSEPVDVSTEPVELPERTFETHAQLSSSRNDVKAVELYLENARNNVRLSEAGYFPTVSVDGAYQFNDHRQPFGSEGESWTVQAFLRWEFFDGLKRERERAKAKFEVSRTEEQLAALIKVVSFQVYEAHLGVEETKKNVDLAASALRTSEEGKRLVQMRYNGFLAPIVDLLDAQSNLDRARAAYIVRLNDYRLARAHLSYQSGSLLADLGIAQEKPEE